MGDLHVFFITALCILGLTADASVVTNSSVTKSLFKRQTQECAGAEYFLCKSGECLVKYSLCDSMVDCADRSDEAAAVCQALYKGRCQKSQWRCNYGACLNETQRCDRKVDCWDGSDEENCPLEPLPSKEPCTVPSTRNTLYYSWSNDLVRKLPGSTVQHDELLLVSTDLEKGLGEKERQAFLICNNGVLSPSQSTKCPANNNGKPVNTGVTTQTKKYYVENQKKLKWLEAFMYCKTHKSRLAVVTSREENDEINKAMHKAILGIPPGSEYFFWIGATDLARKGVWSWLSTGRTIVNYLDYTNWEWGQPDNAGGNEHCVQYFRVGDGFTWNDDSCDHETYFVCEYLE